GGAGHLKVVEHAELFDGDDFELGGGALVRLEVGGGGRFECGQVLAAVDELGERVYGGAGGGRGGRRAGLHGFLADGVEAAFVAAVCGDGQAQVRPVGEIEGGLALPP